MTSIPGLQVQPDQNPAIDSTIQPHTAEATDTTEQQQQTEVDPEVELEVEETSKPKEDEAPDPERTDTDVDNDDIERGSTVRVETDSTTISTESCLYPKPTARRLFGWQHEIQAIGDGENTLLLVGQLWGQRKETTGIPKLTMGAIVETKEAATYVVIAPALKHQYGKRYLYYMLALNEADEVCLVELRRYQTLVLVGEEEEGSCRENRIKSLLEEWMKGFDGNSYKCEDLMEDVDPEPPRVSSRQPKKVKKFDPSYSGVKSSRKDAGKEKGPRSKGKGTSKRKRGVSNQNSTDTASYTCDGCEQAIIGTRYHCSVCKDYDLCEFCETLDPHPSNHPLLLIKDKRRNVNRCLHNLYIYIFTVVALSL